MGNRIIIYVVVPVQQQPGGQILWEEDLQAVCMKERLAILELSETNPKEMINWRNEVYGACRHGSFLKRSSRRLNESKFHRCRRASLSL